jgi:hypothetical protein
MKLKCFVKGRGLTKKRVNVLLKGIHLIKM